jgi:hypothetical protein
MPLTIHINTDLPCSEHERQIIALIKTLEERGDETEMRRILSHQTGRSLIRRGVIIATDGDD